MEYLGVSMIVNVFFYVFFSFEFMRESRVNVDSIHFIYHICIPTCTIQYIYIYYIYMYNTHWSIPNRYNDWEALVFGCVLKIAPIRQSVYKRTWCIHWAYVCLLETASPRPPSVAAMANTLIILDIYISDIQIYIIPSPNIKHHLRNHGSVGICHKIGTI